MITFLLFIMLACCFAFVWFVWGWNAKKGEQLCESVEYTVARIRSLKVQIEESNDGLKTLELDSMREKEIDMLLDCIERSEVRNLERTMKAEVIHLARYRECS